LHTVVVAVWIKVVVIYSVPEAVTITVGEKDTEWRLLVIIVDPVIVTISVINTPCLLVSVLNTVIVLIGVFIVCIYRISKSIVVTIRSIPTRWVLFSAVLYAVIITIRI
jgi:hypothetical protein